MKEKKGVYLLPNLFTTASLFAGFCSIVASIQAHWERAVITIIIAGILDGLDGRIARLTGAVSNFGVQYDSLSDLIAFGVAPSILAYTYALYSFGRWGWLAAFLFLACGALRLARFNVQVKKLDIRFFTGLPIPAAAGTLALTVFNLNRLPMEPALRNHILIAFTYILSFLMVSTFRYYSFKDLEHIKDKPFRVALGVVLLLVLIMSQPFFILWCMGIAYAVSAPISFVLYLMRRRKEEKTSKVDIV